MSDDISHSELQVALRLEEPGPLIPGKISYWARERRLTRIIIRVDQQFSGNYGHDLVVAYPPHSIAAFISPARSASLSKYNMYSPPTQRKISSSNFYLSDVFNIAMSFEQKAQRSKSPQYSSQRPANVNDSARPGSNEFTSTKQNRYNRKSSVAKARHNAIKGRDQTAEDGAPILAPTHKRIRVNKHQECFPDLFWANDPAWYGDCKWDCSYHDKVDRKFDDWRRRSLERHWKWGDFRRDKISAQQYWDAMHAKADRPVSESERYHVKWKHTRLILFGTDMDVPIPVCPGREIDHTRRRDICSLPPRPPKGSQVTAPTPDEFMTQNGDHLELSRPMNIEPASDLDITNLLGFMPATLPSTKEEEARQLFQIEEMSRQLRQTCLAVWRPSTAPLNFDNARKLDEMIQNANDGARRILNDISVSGLEHSFVDASGFLDHPMTELSGTPTLTEMHSTLPYTMSSPAAPQANQVPYADLATPASPMPDRGTGSHHFDLGSISSGPRQPHDSEQLTDEDHM